MPLSVGIELFTDLYTDFVDNSKDQMIQNRTNSNTGTD